MTTRPATAVDDRPASLGRRCVAVLVDQLVVLALGGGLVLVGMLRTAAALRTGVVPSGGVPAGLVVAGAVLATVVAVVQWVLHGRFGWTLGRLLLGVRTVDVHSRRPIGAGRVLLRGCVVAAGSLVVGVGQYVVLLSPLLDRTGRLRGWHDRAVDAEVLRAATPAGRRTVPGRDHARVVPAPAPGPTPVDAAPVATPRPVAAAASASPADRSDAPPPAAPATPGGGLVLAPLHPQRAAPDLDTRAIPAVRATPTLAFGLAPELEMTRPARPRTDVVPDPRPGTSTGLRVTFDDGRVLTVDRLALVGRNPSPAPDVQVVRVVDPSRSVSKTHLQLAVDSAGGAWVVDRGSTNGTLVTLPDGAQVVCPVDHPVRLRVGARVAFGDRSLRVLATPEARGPR